MRVALLTNAFPPEEKGGAGRIASLQADALKASGHEVRVWQPPIAWLKRGTFVRMFGHLNDLKARRPVAQEILEWKPDVLISHNLTGCGFGTPRLIQVSGVRWIHVLHDVQLFEPSGQLVSAQAVTLWQSLWSTLRRRALGVPDLVVSPTRWLLSQHERRGLFVGATSEILPNPAPQVERLDRQLHVPLRLLFVGRVSEDKGVNLLAGLASELQTPFELRVIGEGPEVENLKNFRSKISCLGALPPEQVREEMRRADVLLVPSQIEENQPTVILEAAAVGLPVVASHKGGIAETLDGAGQICPADDLKEWLKAIQSLSDSVTYGRASEAMYRLAEKHAPKAYATSLNQCLEKSKR